MKKLAILTLFFVTSIFSGCKKYLDIKPKGYLIPQTVEDYERILNQEKFTTTLTPLIEALSDDYYLAAFNPNNYEINPANKAYLWNANIFTTAEDFRSESCYHLLYANIYQYNAVINGIDAATMGTAERKAIAKARAELGRALSFWFLLNLYAKPYDIKTAALDPGISLVTSNDIGVKLPGRGTVQASYDFILKDLNEAIPALPLFAGDPFQLTKAAGYAILARTYLTMGNYIKAGEAAENALALNNKLLNYNTEYTTYNIEGSDFISAKDNSLLRDNRVMPENILVQYYWSGFAYEISPVTEKLFPAEDLRRINFFPFLKLNVPNDQWDRKTYTFWPAYVFNVGIGAPEMYLIRAEANARAGNITAALQDVNTLRKHRIKVESYADLTAGNAKDALKIVLEERRRELLFKGTRWFDMRRLNSDPDFGFTAKHYFPDGSFIELPPGSPRYVLRLPETAINADIIQNP